MASAPTDPQAQYDLARKYLGDADVPEDAVYDTTAVRYQKAAEWYRKAAEQGHADAQFELATMYVRGDGVPADTPVERAEWVEKALALFEQAAQRGHADAQFTLARIYAHGEANGEDVPRDTAKATAWYRKAAESYRRAAEQGDSNAQNAQLQLGGMYENGEGVPQDKAEAIKWYRKGGDLVALERLGVKEAEPPTSGTRGPAPPTSASVSGAEPKETPREPGIVGTLKVSEGARSAPTTPPAPYGADTALGNDPMKALGALMGDQVGEDFGFGGLGLRGKSRGGGGTGEGTIGLGNVGVIGHGAGGGEGKGYGRGGKGFTGKSAKVPAIRKGREEQEPAALGKPQIQKFIESKLGVVRFCYEQELNTQPDLAGTVTTRFSIAPDGSVSAVQKVSSTLGNEKVESCILDAVGRWKFPASEGGSANMTYPFVLEPPVEKSKQVTLSKEFIQRVIQRHINEVRFCYEQELNARPDLAGRVVVKIVISPAGKVSSSILMSSTLGNERAETCILGATRRWTFLDSRDGAIMEYPFLLEPSRGQE